MVAQVGQDAGGLAAGQVVSSSGRLGRGYAGGSSSSSSSSSSQACTLSRVPAPHARPAPAGIPSSKPSLRPHLRAARGRQVPVAALGKGLGAGRTGQCNEGPAVGAQVHGAEEEVLSCKGEGRGAQEALRGQQYVQSGWLQPCTLT